jgi:8-oxo-dGTP pyrophosphatase MutT (NUDIX family)
MKVYVAKTAKRGLGVREAVVEDHSVFLEATNPLVPGDAVAALLLLHDGRYVMQLRDLKPEIFYPGHWGLFGGAVDSGEKESDALCRELEEELGFRAQTMARFVRLTFDLSSIGAGEVHRAIYEVPVTASEFEAFRLREGNAYKAFTVGTILTELTVTPYDSFAIWLHHARARLAPVGQNFTARVPSSL